MKTISIKPFWKSKTMWLGFATFLISIVEYWQKNTISPNIILLLGVMIIILRFLTTQPISVSSSN